MNAAFSPRIVGELRPDFYCLETFLDFPRWRGKRDEPFVMAVYNHLTSQVDGTYHFWPSSEREGNLRMRRVNNDPMQIFNAYGFAICGQMSHMLYTIWQTAGEHGAGTRARLYGLPGHALCEVHYDGRWHHFDVDMWSWFRTPEGHVASAFELATNARALIFENTSKSNPCNLPDRSLEDYATMYSKADKGDGQLDSIRPDWMIRAHTMDFHLRPGESVLRTQENQGRFVMPQEWTQFKEKFQREWHGTPRERFAPFRTFGNGRWVYAPDLTNECADFAAGVWDKKGVRQSQTGLYGRGHATFRVQSPWPFCGIPNWQNVEKITYTNGVWLEVAGQGSCTVELTDPEGQWTQVFRGEGPFEERIDVTSWLAARYECFIRFTLGQGAKLRKFRFEGFFQIAPMTIPRLVEGPNPMELRCGDKHGQHTVPWSRIIDMRAAADLPAQWLKARNAKVEDRGEGWRQIAPAEPGKPVQVVWRFDAPKGRPFGWVYLHASLREGPVNEPARKALIEWSLDGKDWRPLADRDVCNTPAQWDCSLEGEILLPDRAPRVYVRVTSGTAISGVEFYGHVRVGDDLDGAIEITHFWKQDGLVKEFAAPADATMYTLTCGKSPYAHAVRMSRPSIRR